MTSDQAFARGMRTAVRILISLAGAAAVHAAGVESAPGPANAATQPMERELIPGADRMTDAARDTYRRRMAEAATAEEKARIHAEYVKAAEQPVPPAALVGDPKRGAALHSACFSCHGIERYVAPVTYAAATFLDSVLRASGLSDLPPAEPTRFKGRVKSLADLREGVMRRND